MSGESECTFPVKYILFWIRNGRNVPEDYAQGLQGHRELQNAVDQGDGYASLLQRPPQFLDVEEDTELRLLDEHIECSYGLFVWLADQLLPHSRPG